MRFHGKSRKHHCILVSENSLVLGERRFTDPLGLLRQDLLNTVSVLWCSNRFHLADDILPVVDDVPSSFRSAR
jgi:hypothetical protein